MFYRILCVNNIKKLNTKLINTIKYVDIFLHKNYMLRQNNKFVLLHSIFYYKHILNNKNENLIIDVNFYQ